MWQKLNVGQWLTSRPPLIALSGAGGKTSCLWYLANTFACLNKSVLATTTTRMFYPKSSEVSQCWIESEHKLCARLTQDSQPGITFAASAMSSHPDKVAGVTPMWLEAIVQQGRFDLILVEADGSRGLPLKAPASHEPVIPVSTKTQLIMTGAECLLTPLDPRQIHRWPHFEKITNAKSGELIDHKMITRLFAHPQGMLQGSPALSRKIWFINKADRGDHKALQQLGETVLTQTPQLDEVWLGQLNSSPSIIRIIKERL
ncbi:selenium cofactor biosynthesis protein YqeC [Dongshaea marina]|uniref:selenium cofactor biosynthesis protein YqeC n=1 Tax=Dongshaea marina TaxID=2047966 RepID=UPI000D3E9829|nr:selenium cofactor biosynthesis protein YqeC [Dongshaea marina]